MPRAIDYPRISVKFFRNTKSRINFLQGNLNWVTPEGVKVVAIYDFGIIKDHGYLALRYNDPSEPILELNYSIHLKPYLNNYNHKVWQFLCPECKRTVRELFYVRGPIFICWACGKLDRRRKIDGFEKMKTELKVGSPAKKLRALERLIQMREAIKRAKRT